ncbi:MAG TPA: HD domain-containing protein [Candidatus Thermoplasmatota archaeon]|nr:HD domain-containing protein [Candidatus Thermoplasmatota archaeon]
MHSPYDAALRALVMPLMAKGNDPCHDLHHLDRVHRNAVLIARSEKADVEVVGAAAYVHDLDRAGMTKEEAQRLAADLLVQVGFPAAKRDAVMECVRRHSDYTFKPGGKKPTTLEARVLQDADKLEAIGAIGAARAFSFGGLKARPLWDGEKPIEGRPYTTGVGGDASTLQHFYDKLLRLTPDEFNTAAGKRAAAERQEFLRAYLAAFYREWHGEDLPR